MSDLVRMCVSLEQSLFDQVERITEEGEFTNRSEMVRDLVRQRLNCEDFDAETIVDCDPDPDLRPPRTEPFAQAS